MQATIQKAQAKVRKYSVIFHARGSTKPLGVETFTGTLPQAQSFARRHRLSMFASSVSFIGRDA